MEHVLLIALQSLNCLVGLHSLAAYRAYLFGICFESVIFSPAFSSYRYDFFIAIIDFKYGPVDRAPQQVADWENDHPTSYTI